MDISVIIPVFDRRATLPRAIDSVLAQHHPACEIIVVDDGSTDDVESLISSRYPDCIFIQQSNHGVSHARNRGIEAARSDWIALLDSDDEWLPGKLAAQVAKIQRSPGVLFCHTEEIWIRNGKRVNAMKKHAKAGGHIFRRCLPLCVISPSSALLHRSLFDRYGLFDESLPACEDYDLWLRICAHEPVAFVETPQIIKYGGHADQLSRRHWGMDRFRIQALEKIIVSGQLHEGDRQAAIQTLIDKAAILAQGARKRGKQQRAEYYSALQHHYAIQQTNPS